MLLDSDGVFLHWKYPGAYADQPWIDIQIYQVIRKKWVELKNKAMNGRFNALKETPSSGKRKRPFSRRR